AHQRRNRLQLAPLLRTVDGRTAQAGIDGAVLVLHGHDAVAPAVEGEVERWLITPRKAGVGVVDEDAIRVADDAVRIEEEAIGDGAAVVLAAHPAEHAVIVAQVAGAALGLIAAVRAARIDEGLEGVGLVDADRLLAGLSKGRRSDQRNEQQNRAAWHG